MFYGSGLGWEDREFPLGTDLSQDLFLNMWLSLLIKEGRPPSPGLHATGASSGREGASSNAENVRKHGPCKSMSDQITPHQELTAEREE